MPRVNAFRSRFLWKTYTSFALLFLGTTLVISWVAFYKIGITLNAAIVDNLRAKAEFMVPEAKLILAGSSGQATIRALGHATSTRITVIREGGIVAADSDSDAVAMENHWTRPEVQQSLTDPYGLSERLSVTIRKPLLYLAKAIYDTAGNRIGVIRVSLSTDKIRTDMNNLRLTMGAVACLGVAFALSLGWTLARRVSVPIREMVLVAEAMRAGKYSQRVRTITDDELGRLGDTLNRLGAELTNKISELQRLETVRRDFVANVSHEIKTPLTSIKGYVETLLSGAINEPDNRMRFLAKIERNSERLANLVQDLLSLARIEAAQDAVLLTETDWTEIVTSVVARNEDTITAKSLRIAVNLPKSPLRVMGDREAMTQVLDNLFTNALKYTPSGGRITVAVAARGKWACLEVEDTGIGIPAEHLERIFERFYRVDKARSRELGGTGLGLSIVKHLVASMGGEVQVESTVNVGSRFTVKLRFVA